MANKILTFKPNWSKKNYNAHSGRWTKQINGRVKSFGTGSKSDTKSYLAAEKAYLEFLHNQESQKPVEVPINQATLADVVEVYLQNLFARYERQDVSAQHFSWMRRHLIYFIKHFGKDTLINDLTELDLEQYKNFHAGRQDIAKITARDFLSTVKIFFRWGWKMSLIEKLPRNIDDLTKITSGRAKLVKTLPKIFTMDELKTLWDAASSRVKLYMALGLNCGHTQKDISDLRASELDLEHGSIKRERSKTKVYAECKLFDVTLALIEQHRHQCTAKTDGTERVFLTEKRSTDTLCNEPLIRAKIKADGSLDRTDVIKCAFFRLQKKTGINGGRSFRSLRKTGASIIEQIDPMCTEMYLSHSERGMKQFYAQRDWSRLSEALQEMENRLSGVIY